MSDAIENYADVILPLPLEGCFTYLVPEELNSRITSGMRVVVQFGVKKFYSALVRRVHNDKPENVSAKLIESVLDEQPILSETCFLLWEWIADYYQCSLGEVLKAALPSGLKLESETRVSMVEDHGNPDLGHLSPKEQMLLEIIREKRVISVF